MALLETPKSKLIGKLKSIQSFGLNNIGSGISTYFILSFLLITISPFRSFAQIELSGKVLDASTKEALIGATIMVRGTENGTSTNFEGQFTLNIKELPVTLEISYLGYITKSEKIHSVTKPMVFSLSEDVNELIGVDVIESRITEKQKQAPLTILAMDAASIKTAPSGNFYESLGNLKGVDVTSASLGFKVVNTRGFNSTSPVRTLQLIDGVDNQSPGLNFSLGNFLGSSELDLVKVEIIAGASSAFYGPGAFNGVISMQTKDPFVFKGLTVQHKFGERNMNELAVRWADAVKNKKGREVFGYKINLYYLNALDWEAENYNPTTDSKVGLNNPGGYDAVNIYGDEALGGGNNYTTMAGQLRRPGLGYFYRTGYMEKDLVDYETKNLKSNIGLYFNLTEDVQLNYSLNYGNGTTVYQGDNRYSLKGIQFLQNKIELKKEDKFFIRAYATHEDAGNSYDAVLTGFLLNQNAKADGDWYRQYLSYWESNGGPGSLIRTLDGFPPFAVPFDTATARTVLNQNSEFVKEQHRKAANNANTTANGNDQPHFEPGTAAFDSAFASITSKLFTEGGSRFYDKSALYHVQGEYQLDLKKLGVFRIGGNYRLYTPNSKGTIFADTIADRTDTIEGGFFNPDGEYVKITNSEIGLYAGLEKSFANNRFKASATLRADKNQNFNTVFSPAISLVYTSEKKDVIRLSFSSAVRNPTLADQYLYYNVGRAILLGNLNGYDSLVTVSSFRDYINSPNFEKENLTYFNVDAVKPEQVKTAELGTRFTVKNRLYVDAGAYYSFYTNFIGYNLGIDLEMDVFGRPTPATTAYRVTTNAKGLTTTRGVSIGLNYYLSQYFTLTGNYSYNELVLEGTDEQIIPAFNTPRNKFNVGLTAKDLPIEKFGWKHFGFGLNYKWIEGFVFEGSPQFTGQVPTYSLLDLQINKNVPKINCTFKLGASNLLNNKVFQVYGGPYVGRLAYFSILYDFKKGIKNL